MESNWVTKNRRTIFRLVVLALAGAAIYLVRKDLLATLMPYLYAAILAFVLNPLVNYLEKRGVKRTLSALMCMLLIFLMMLAFALFFIPSVVRDITTLVKRLTGDVDNLKLMLDSVTEQLSTWVEGTIDLDSRMEELLAKGTQLLSSWLARVVASLGALVHVLLVPVIVFYLLKDKDDIMAALIGLFRPSQREKMRSLGEDIQGLLSGYVKGKVIISVMVGLFTGVGCLLIGLPNALTIGLVAGLFDLIPYFGPWLGGILPMIIALMGTEPIKALWVLILILVIQQVESNLITPRVISQRVGLHPLLVMFSVIFFGSVMGIPGMILGVPIMAVLIRLLMRARGNLEAEEEEAERQASAPRFTKRRPRRCDGVRPRPRRKGARIR